MKKSEIKVGGHYRAKVNDKVVTVRVDAVRDGGSDRVGGSRMARYDVTNLSTGRKTTFRSAMKFLSEVKPVKKLAEARADLRKVKDGIEAEHKAIPAPLRNLGNRGGQHELRTDAVTAEEEKAKRLHDLEVKKNHGTLTSEERVEMEGLQDPATLPDLSARTEGKKSSDPTTYSTRVSSPVAVAAPPAASSPATSGLGARLGVSLGDSDDAPHLIVEARAGTGKTTTLVEGVANMRGLRVDIVPSPQQKAVWEQLALSKGAKSICMTCFNKPIQEVLTKKLAERGLDRMGCVAMTMHGLGYRAVTMAFGRQEPKDNVVARILEEMTGKTVFDLRRESATLVPGVERLVSLCKMNLVGRVEAGEYLVDREEMEKLASHYDLDLNGARDRIYEMVPQVLTKCLTPRGQITFDDMIWLPVIHNLPVTRHDLLLVDEAQDLNRCQQALAKKAGKRLVLVGDPKQAIYGFAGADSKSMDRMYEELGGVCPRCSKQREYLGEEGSKFGHNYWSCECGMGSISEKGCIKLPLTVTRRCGKAIVTEANRLVKDFEAHESNGEGLVNQASYSDKRPDHYSKIVRDGDMVLCRVNAPLVSECFRFIRAGRKATIQGRDIGQGIINLIERQKAGSVVELVQKLETYFDAEERKEQAKKFPSEARMIALGDRRDCIMCFCEGQVHVSGVIQRINEIFTADTNVKGIKLSSIHKAKGLEADRVFLINTKEAPCPHPMAKTAWQHEQELNLLYVAITRAKHELVYVV